MAKTEGKFIKHCGYCSTQFKGRLNSLFCSTSCRSNHWQRNSKAIKSEETFNKKGLANVRRFYVGSNSHDAILSCPICKKNGKIGLFYFAAGKNTFITCDNCMVIYKREKGD